MKKEPIKRNKNILKLSKEHHFSLLFCWKIRQGVKYEVAKERMVKYARYFRDSCLDPHFREEETILFAPLKDKPVKKAIDDHKQINCQFDELQGITENNAKERLVNLANAIDEHVRYEERILFPHLEKMLSDVQLTAIGNQLDSGQILPFTDEYRDEFWRKK